jgi:hypothetical protein
MDGRVQLFYLRFTVSEGVDGKVIRIGGRVHLIIFSLSAESPIQTEETERHVLMAAIEYTGIDPQGPSIVFDSLAS